MPGDFGNRPAAGARPAAAGAGNGPAAGPKDGGRAQAQAQAFLLGQAQQLRLEEKIALLNQKRELLDQLKAKGLEDFAKLEPAVWHSLYFPAGETAEHDRTGHRLLHPRYRQKYSLTENCRMWQAQSGGKATYRLDTSQGPQLGIWLMGETYDVDLSAQALLDRLFEIHQTKLADCLFEQKAGSP